MITVALEFLVVQGYRFRHPHPQKPDRLRIYEAHIGIASEDETISTYEYFTHNVLPRIEELGKKPQ